ncbi:MAG: hypothetical protein ACMUIU_07260 [bacterium]
MPGKNTYKTSFAFMFCFFAFSLFFLIPTLQCQWYSYPPPMNNLNFNGFPGNSPWAFSNYPPAYGSSPVLRNFSPIPGYSGFSINSDPYGNPWMPYFPPTSGSKNLATARFSFVHLAVDGDYIYALFTEARGRNRSALVIFEASGSDDYEYLSHITLYEPGYLIDANPAPMEIIIKDDLAVIGGDDQGMIYLVDISEKDDPELINKLILGNRTADDSAADRVTGLAIEDDVLFVSVPFFVENDSRIYAVDISNPEDTDEDDDLLDSFTVDDYDVHGMVSSQDYLYVVGRDRGYPDGENEGGATILIMDVSDPEHLSLEEIFDDLDDSSLGEPDDLSVEIAGDYLFVTCGDFEGSSSESKLRIIDISDPEDPDLISSSKKMTGTQIFGNRYISVKDNYAYVLASDTSDKESGIYVYDISDPEDPDLVETRNISDGSGYDLHLVDDRLFVHIINQGIIKLIDISDPRDLSIEGTVDLAGILEEAEEFDDWGYTGYVVPPYLYGGYPPYGYSYTPPPLYTPSLPIGYNTPYGTSRVGLGNVPNYYGYAQPFYGGNLNYASRFGFNYGQIPYGGYPNYGPVPGYSYGLSAPYFGSWRQF